MHLELLGVSNLKKTKREKEDCSRKRTKDAHEAVNEFSKKLKFLKNDKGVEALPHSFPSSLSHTW